MNIVKVRYITGEFNSITDTRNVNPREYTYFSEEPLQVGQVINVPAKDHMMKAIVSAIDVPEDEIAAFKDKVKTIPAGGSKPELPPSGLAAAAQAAGAEVTVVEMKTELFPEATTLTLTSPTSDLAILRFLAESNQLRDYSIALTITTNAELAPANDNLVIIRRIKKALEEKRKDYLRPFQDHVKETNDAYKTLMKPIEEADTIMAGKMLAFNNEQQRKIREAEAIEAEKMALARREAELNNGAFTVDLTPVTKPEAVPERVTTNVGTTGFTDHWVFVGVTDFALVPDEYKIVDVVKIGKVVRAGLHTIPGCRIENQPIVSTR
jgi:hypothetical protein